MSGDDDRVGAEKVPRVYHLAALLALERGARSIKDLPGCYEADVDDDWWVAANGHGTTRACSRAVEIPPYAMYFERRGIPAALVDPAEGYVADDRENELILALEAALKRQGVNP